MILCPAGSNSYTVRPGDSLWAIAQRFRTTVSAITTANPGLNINNLLIGQTLCIPSGPMQPSSPFFRKDEQALHDHMRLLWTQHVYWTRMVLLGLVFDLPDTNAATARLFRNPKRLQVDSKAVLWRRHCRGLCRTVRKPSCPCRRTRQGGKGGQPRHGRPTQKRGGIKMQIRSPPSWAVSILTGRPSNGRRCCMTTLQ